MRQEPLHRLDPKIQKVWLIHGVIEMLIALVITLVVVGGVFIANAPLATVVLVASIGLGITVVVALISVLITPKLLYRIWRYEVTDTELYIQHGLIIKKRSLVPLVRVQDVQTSQGPIMRSYGLSEINVSTAGEGHTIPGLTQEEAETLRDKISVLARIAQEDV